MHTIQLYLIDVGRLNLRTQGVSQIPAKESFGSVEDRNQMRARRKREESSLNSVSERIWQMECLGDLEK